MDENPDLYTYTVTYSYTARQFIGTCAEYPELKFYDKKRETASKGIQRLVNDVVKNEETKKLLVSKTLTEKQILKEEVNDESSL